MGKKFAAVVSMFLIVGLLLPGTAAARRETVVGSLTIGNGQDLQGKIVGVAVTSNPGLEKTIVQPLPPLAVPVVLDLDVDDSPGRPNGPRILRNLDTFVLLTNVTDVPLAVVLQLRGGDGQVLGSGTVEIPGRGTRGVSLVDVLGQFSP